MGKFIANVVGWFLSLAQAPLRWRPSRRATLSDEQVAERRRALVVGAAAAAGLLTTIGDARRAGASPAVAVPDPGPVTGRRWGMAIDLNTCTGCNSCQVACRQENNIPTYGPEETYEAGRIEWMSMLWDEPKDELKLPQITPFPCQQCQDAPCVKVCPVGATFKDSEGIIVQVWDRCIGCRYCMVACPYDRRFFNWEDPKFEGSLAQMLNPDVATRTAGIVEKCTFCSHRITKLREDVRLEGREMVDGDHQKLTACATACPADAITFGDLNDPESAVAKLKRGPNVFRMLEHLGTDPSVFYLKRERMEDS